MGGQQKYHRSSQKSDKLNLIDHQEGLEPEAQATSVATSTATKLKHRRPMESSGAVGTCNNGSYAGSVTGAGSPNGSTPGSFQSPTNAGGARPGRVAFAQGHQQQQLQQQQQQQQMWGSAAPTNRVQPGVVTLGQQHHQQEPLAHGMGVVAPGFAVRGPHETAGISMQQKQSVDFNLQRQQQLEGQPTARAAQFDGQDAKISDAVRDMEYGVDFGTTANVQTDYATASMPPPGPPTGGALPEDFHPPRIFSTLELQVHGERGSVEIWTGLLVAVSMLHYILAPYEITCGKLASLHGILKIAHNYFSLWAVFLSIPVVWQQFYQEQLLEFTHEYRLPPQLGIYLQSWIFHQSVERFHRYIVLEGVIGDALVIFLMLLYDTSFILDSGSHTMHQKCSVDQNIIAMLFVLFYFYHWLSSLFLLVGLSKSRKLVELIHHEMKRPIPEPQREQLREEWQEWQPGFNEIMIVLYYGIYKLRRTKFAHFVRRLLSAFVKEWRENEATTTGDRTHANILVESQVQ